LARIPGEQVFSFLKWHTEEDFHREVAKIAKGHSNSSVSGAFGLVGDRRAIGTATEEDFHTEVAKIAKAGRGYAQLQKLPIDSPLHSREPPHATSQATNAAN
jgi:hypothetical protein